MSYLSLQSIFSYLLFGNYLLDSDIPKYWYCNKNLLSPESKIRTYIKNKNSYPLAW